MPSKLLLSAALCAPCAAFVPAGNARNQQQVTSLRSGVQQPQSETVSGKAYNLATGGLIGAGAASLILGAVRSGRRQQRVLSTERSVVGVCLPLTEKFDPLNLGNTDEKMEKYTVAEIKHGRVAMIATMGYFMPENFRFPGCESFENGLGAFSTIPLEGWVQLIAFIGAHDILVKPRDGGMGAYDLGFGTELLDGIDDEELERRQTVERNNGRLAMIAIIGLMFQDWKFGKTPIELIKEGGFWGPPVDFIIQDIPICRSGTLCAVKPPVRGPGLTAMRATVYKEVGEGFPEKLEPEKMSAAVPFLKYPKPLEGWVGGEKGFDPLLITWALPTYIVREAELKHGRVCMLATVGWIATDLGVRFPGEVFQKCTTMSAHDQLVDAGIMGPFLGAIACYELYAGWLFFQGFEGKINRDAGDFFLGKNFLPKDEDKANEMKLKELENGRLAMLAFSGIVTQAALTGKTWPFL